MRMVKTPIEWFFVSQCVGVQTAPPSLILCYMGSFASRHAKAGMETLRIARQKAPGQRKADHQQVLVEDTLVCVGYLTKSSLGSCYFPLLISFEAQNFCLETSGITQLWFALRPSHKP